MKPEKVGGQTLLRLAQVTLDEFRGVKTPVADPGSFISAFDERVRNGDSEDLGRDKTESDETQGPI
jgi:hypothetical protein